MLRKITVSVGRYKEGNQHDYPRGVWNKIAADLAKAKENAEVFKGVNRADNDKMLAAFSVEIEFNPSHNAMTRGPNRNHPRLGTGA